jgi:hypothetical protein
MQSEGAFDIVACRPPGRKAEGTQNEERENKRKEKDNRKKDA